MKYPSIKEIKICEDRIQICKWYRYLPSPSTQLEQSILHHIVRKFEIMGGFNPEISKIINW